MSFASRIGDRFVDLTHYCGHWAHSILLALIVSTPLMIWAIAGALDKADNDLIGWVDDRLPAKHAFTKFSDKFGRQDLLIVSWPGCTLDDPRLAQLASLLSTSDEADCFARITTTTSLLQKLTSEPFDLSPARVIRSLVGNALGPDLSTSCLMLELSPEGTENRNRSIGAIDAAADRIPGLDSGSLRMGGPAFELWALTDESIRSPVMLCIVAIVFIALISYLLLRSLPICTLVTGIAVFNGSMSIALVYFTGHGMNAVLMPMPTLVMVLSVSCSVHVVNYYRKANQACSGDVLRSTLEAAWLPCVLSAVTSAIGLAALITSKTGPVREFGCYSAAAIVIGTTLILMILPATLSRLPDASQAGRSASAGRRRFWRRMAVRIDAYHWPIVTLGIGIVVSCMPGLRWLHTSMTLTNTFAAETRVIQDAEWLERNVRPLSQLEVVVSCDEADTLSSIQQLMLVADVSKQIGQQSHVGATLSLADFLPAPPRTRSLRSVTRRAVINRMLENHRESLIESGYLAVSGGKQYWRISVAVSSLSTMRYAALIESVARTAESTVDSIESSGGISVECTGAIPLYDGIQRQMLRDLLSTYGTAFVAITLTMCLALFSIRAGLIAMLPNVFPAIVMLGLLGWLDVRMDVGSIMTASVALGIAVDGTLHYVIAYRRSVASGSSQLRGIAFGLSRCGVALTQATIICAVGIHFLGYSDFLPTARFGWLIAAMLSLALIGDLILLPALLAGPLGSLFARVPREKSTKLVE